MTKRGLAAALHFGDPAFKALPAYFQQQLGPVLQALLDAAADAGAIRDGVDPLDLLAAVAKLCIPPAGTDDTSRADRMIAILIDGLRYGASPLPLRSVVPTTSGASCPPPTAAEIIRTQTRRAAITETRTRNLPHDRIPMVNSAFQDAGLTLQWPAVARSRVTT